jgi:hypothetical protein
MVQTVVAKVDNALALATLGAAELTHGAAGFAVVENRRGQILRADRPHAPRPELDLDGVEAEHRTATGQS